MSNRGGKRIGAGRKKKYTYLTKAAIQLRVAELRKENPRLTDNAAIAALQSRKELPPGETSKFARYLTPAELGNEAHDALRKAPERVGLIGLIPEIDIKK